MTIEETRRRRLYLETEHAIEAKTHGQTPHLFELNKLLTQAIFEEAHASRDPEGTSES